MKEFNFDEFHNHDHYKEHPKGVVYPDFDNIEMLKEDKAKRPSLPKLFESNFPKK